MFPAVNGLKLDLSRHSLCTQKLIFSSGPKFHSIDSQASKNLILPWTQNLKKNRLIIFAREPRSGRVKTRLKKVLGPIHTTSLYKAFVKDVLQACRQVSCTQRVIYHTGSRKIPFLGQFKKHFEYQRQSGNDLGQRMLHAFSESKNKGFEKIVIVGTDTPHISPTIIRKAFHKLSRYNVVLGPSRDGGYYLIGLNDVIPGLFSGIRWGTQGVLLATIQKARRLKKKVCQLQPLDDIDTINSLRRFLRTAPSVKQAVHSWKMIKRLKFLEWVTGAPVTGGIKRLAGILILTLFLNQIWKFLFHWWAGDGNLS